jgi:nucleoside-diphosphate-sugar epimerase
VNRVLVTGVAGRLGRAVAPALAARGVAVTGLDRVDVDGELPLARMVVGPATDPATVRDALAGVDAVVHLAAIPAPTMGHPAEQIFGDNALATFVVLDNAGRSGVARAVIASSQSVLGFAFAPSPLTPLYLPIDAAHPLLVADPYALSKQADEATAAMMARAYGMTVVALRFPFLGGLGDRLIDQARVYRDRPETGTRPLWAYLEDRDAATAAVLSLTAPLSGYHMITVAAPETLAAQPTEDLLELFFPQVPRRAPLPGRAVPWDTSEATVLLGFEPVHLFDPS